MSALHKILCEEGPLRERFEGEVKRRYYRTERDADGEYVQAAVFHMWTGYCIATLQTNQEQQEQS